MKDDWLIITRPGMVSFFWVHEFAIVSVDHAIHMTFL